MPPGHVTTRLAMAVARIRIAPLRVVARAPSLYRLTYPNSKSQTCWSLPRRSFTGQSVLLEKKYTEDHEWIELSPDGKIGTIGITNYASKALGDVVYVELPSKDLKVTRGDTIGAVESVKSASDVMTPISGTITDTNGLLEEKPATINKGPEAEGWLAKIQVEDAKEMDGLMTKSEYDKLTEGEGGE
ncbi:hypothetical protein GJ744_004770 [Endocarpon pusillum]|uniref:Glycine cleavage system H protein n=1 Tax=Endocarpon pusillum TaxID=364733 RepID=A0A8H7A9A4_9EURO|nr:hypothetical protein GJ744_004770 [Endocarpon pusillum]